MTVFYEWLYFFTQLCLLDLLFVPVYHYDRRERKLAAAFMVSVFLALFLGRRKLAVKFYDRVLQR